MDKQEQRREQTVVYTKNSKTLGASLKSLFSYGDLILLLAKKNLTIKYRQTVLGALWLILMPLLETAVSAFVFGNIAKISSGTVPYFLFYYVGTTLWFLFYSTAISTGNVFTANASLFHKVNFPRLSVPLAAVLSSLFHFAIRFVLMVVVILVFVAFQTPVVPQWSYLALLPALLLIVVAMALGVGLIFSAITASYRDLQSVLPLCLDLLKYLSPVIYTVVSLDSTLKALCFINPVAPVMECFRFILLGEGNGVCSWGGLAYAFGFAVCLLFVGVLCFNNAERKYIDRL